MHCYLLFFKYIAVNVLSSQTWLETVTLKVKKNVVVKYWQWRHRVGLSSLIFSQFKEERQIALKKSWSCRLTRKLSSVASDKKGICEVRRHRQLAEFFQNARKTIWTWGGGGRKIQELYHQFGASLLFAFVLETLPGSILIIFAKLTRTDFVLWTLSDKKSRLLFQAKSSPSKLINAVKGTDSYWKKTL